MSFKPLFSRTLAADPERLHFAAHSHHLWPDASFEGQVEAWTDAAFLADRKWDRIMGEVWPAAQANVARELGGTDPEAVVFSSNTHDFILRLVSACPRQSGQLRVLTSDGEFHSARRQFDRWNEDGWFVEDKVAAEPFDDVADRFLERARAGDHDLIFVSHVLFGSGRLFGCIEELAALARPEGPWVVIDGYHAFMALDRPLPEIAAATAFYLGGGYKYAMSGEGCAFLHAPAGFGPRPAVTGWFAEFEDLTLPPGAVGYAPDALRFMGATFDPSALYRFNAVSSMLAENGLTTARISAHVDRLQRAFVDRFTGTALADAELLNPPVEGGPHARFLAFRTPAARQLYDALMSRNCITDVRGNVLRIGFALYQDEADVDQLIAHIGALA
ncbi:MAG: class V aminotransferase [Sphingomicrobium sp.]